MIYSSVNILQLYLHVILYQFFWKDTSIGYKHQLKIIILHVQQQEQFVI